MENNPQDVDSNYVDKAVKAVQHKKPLPEIDFTLHTMEDGSQVSTMERVCKGTFASLALQLRIAIACMLATEHSKQASADPTVTARRSSSRLPPAYGRAILLAARSHEAQHPVPEAAFLPRRSLDRATGAMDHQEGHRGPEGRAKSPGDGCTHYRLW
jgi:hypothetical protein